MAPEALAQVLRPLNNLFNNNGHPNLLVGLSVADDAAVYKLNDEQAIINTLDFFTPVVDDPYDYGAIAAANSMSDVYAMGGEVLYALNMGGFPGPMDPAIVTEILRGGAEKVIEAGAVIAGGHTVNDDEPKYGLAVTGIVHPERIFTKGGARPGDTLVLTKPLGTGTLSTALKRGVAAAEHVTEMVASMKRLNRAAAQAAQVVGVKGATDITGFGLLGHGLEMAHASGCKFVFNFGTMPLLPGATIYAEQFIFPGGSANNKLYFEKDVTFDPGLTEAQQMLLWDAQTSGGLLLAVPTGRLAEFEAACAERNQPVWVIGVATAGRGIEVLP
ncbi:MAG: selenide, water dikinase SelD [Anaerolineae bacterium]